MCCCCACTLSHGCSVQQQLQQRHVLACYVNTSDSCHCWSKWSQVYVIHCLGGVLCTTGIQCDAGMRRSHGGQTQIKVNSCSCCLISGSKQSSGVQASGSASSPSSTYLRHQPLLVRHSTDISKPVTHVGKICRKSTQIMLLVGSVNAVSVCASAVIV